AGRRHSDSADFARAAVFFIGLHAPFSSGRFLGVVDGATLGVSAWASGAMLTAASLGTSIASIVVATPGSVSLPPGVTAVGVDHGTSSSRRPWGWREAPASPPPTPRP